MSHHDSNSSHADRAAAAKSKRREPRVVSDLMAGALKDLGVPSMRVTQKLQRAWEACAEESWVGRTRLRRLEGGVLDVGVSSAALRDELANFHKDRLLAVLRTALPDVPLIGMRFVTDPADGDGV